jgi:glutathione S-transferase
VPQSLHERTKEDEWCCYIYGEIDETALYVMRRHGDLTEIYGAAPDVVTATKAYLKRHMDVLAAHIDGKQAVLEIGFGLTDIMLVSCLDWAVFYEVDVPEPVLAYRALIAERPAYQKAMAINYPILFGGGNGPA